MSSNQCNPYPLRIDNNLMDKLKEISKAEGRSVNKQIEFIVRQFIDKYDSNKQ